MAAWQYTACTWVTSTCQVYALTLAFVSEWLLTSMSFGSINTDTAVVPGLRWCPLAVISPCLSPCCWPHGNWCVARVSCVDVWTPSLLSIPGLHHHCCVLPCLHDMA
jgi:hypothetical protein